MSLKQLTAYKQFFIFDMGDIYHSGWKTTMNIKQQQNNKKKQKKTKTKQNKTKKTKMRKKEQ